MTALPAAEAEPHRPTLHDQIALAQKLLAVLEREYELLAQRDIEGLGEAAAEKQSLVAQLDGRGEAYTDDTEADPGLRAELTRLIQSCRHQNTINGAVIDLLTRYNERSLQILLGQTPTETVYGPAGQEHSAGAGRYSASA